jgi:hypothetical protein
MNQKDKNGKNLDIDGNIDAENRNLIFQSR